MVGSGENGIFFRGARNNKNHGNNQGYETYSLTHEWIQIQISGYNVMGAKILFFGTKRISVKNEPEFE